MINLESPRKFRAFIEQANKVADNFLRANSRKYDLGEHTYPKELDMLASLVDGMSDSGQSQGAGAGGVRRDDLEDSFKGKSRVKNGANLSSLLSIIEMSWGDVGLLLTMPRQGLGNSAIASVATDEQLERYKGMWAAMAITESSTGSDSGAITTTATKDGDHYVLNGEKIFVTSGERADSVVVWATLERVSAAPRSSRSSSRRTRPASGSNASNTSSASAHRIPPSSCSTTAASTSRTCSAMPMSTRRRASPVRWRRSTTRVQWLPVWLLVVRALRSS